MSGVRLRRDVLGSAVEVVAPAPVAKVVADLLAGFPATEEPGAVLSLTGADGAWAVRQGVHAVVEDVPTWEQAVLALLQQLNLLVLDAAPVPTVHAAVLRLPGGAVVALPAVSGTGKSTMTAALLADGAEYVSDEALVLGPGRAVTVYPRPLALSAERARALGLPAATLVANGEEVYAPGVLGPVADGPLVLTDVVRLHRRPGPVTISPLAGIEVAPLLLQNCFNHYRDPARAFAVTAEVARGCAGWELGYDEAADAAAALLAQLDFEPRP